LHARERYYIELNKDICVNKNIPTRTKKEYDEDNKEKIKEYYQQNKEKKAEYYQQNKEKKIEQNKEYRNVNKEKRAEHAKQKITCECGSIITIHHKSSHERTKKHQNFINQ
jgi:hypothetical protein